MERTGACREALEMAQSPVETIDYINTHGTGTPAGDLAECLAISRAFGDYRVPISSTKALSGHGIGAAGAHELIYCLLMMKHGFITASVNIEELDPAFVDYAIVRQNRDAKLNKVLTNSFGFGGTNACMIVGTVVKLQIREVDRWTGNRLCRKYRISSGRF